MKYTVPNKNFNYANASCAQTCNGKLFSTDLKINISRKEGYRRAMRLRIESKNKSLR